ncbi:MAG TPA: Maf family nucleotide pyrophosphatase [Candidatus Binataceae bacterium]|nr:Maf family nucleotide pyrophosphatase [Candidatus Binataceae bacterium]
MRIVLASESISRKRALDLIGLRYEVCPSAIDEKAIRDSDPAALTRKLAEAKAWKVAPDFPDAVIISGDAVVAKGGRIYEKPRDLEQAAEFLKELSGGELEFVTSLAVLRFDNRKMLSTVEVSQILFRPLTGREIRDYISSYPVLKCAGAFEGDGVLRFAERISGSYNFLTAIPVSRLIVFLREQGVEI